MCVCVFTHMCKSTCVPEEARGQGQESSSIALHLVFLRQGLSLNVELEMQLELLTRKSRESSCLCFPARSPGIYPVIHFYFLNMGCEAQLGSSCLFCKHITNRATSQLQDYELAVFLSRGPDNKNSCSLLWVIRSSSLTWSLGLWGRSEGLGCFFCEEWQSLPSPNPLIPETLKIGNLGSQSQWGK